MDEQYSWFDQEVYLTDELVKDTIGFYLLENWADTRKKIKLMLNKETNVNINDTPNQIENVEENTERELSSRMLESWDEEKEESFKSKLNKAIEQLENSTLSHLIDEYVQDDTKNTLMNRLNLNVLKEQNYTLEDILNKKVDFDEYPFKRGSIDLDSKQESLLKGERFLTKKEWDEGFDKINVTKSKLDGVNKIIIEGSYIINQDGKNIIENIYKEAGFNKVIFKIKHQSVEDVKYKWGKSGYAERKTGFKAGLKHTTDFDLEDLEELEENYNKLLQDLEEAYTIKLDGEHLNDFTRLQTHLISKAGKITAESIEVKTIQFITKGEIRDIIQELIEEHLYGILKEEEEHLLDPRFTNEHTIKFKITTEKFQGETVEEMIDDLKDTILLDVDINTKIIQEVSNEWLIDPAGIGYAKDLRGMPKGKIKGMKTIGEGKERQKEISSIGYNDARNRYQGFLIQKHKRLLEAIQSL
tara:strand:+ start:3697 stop:5109 length:1413 start_codon:yes stop_codon:yes gene_type:complete